MKRRLITHKFATRWFVGVVRSLETQKRVAGQFAVKYKTETTCSTHQPNRKITGLSSTLKTTNTDTDTL